MNLAIAPFHDWRKCEREGFRTRDAHLMQEFDRHTAVDRMLVINRPVSYAEVVLMRRGWRPRTGVRHAARDGWALTEVSDKTVTLDILVPELVRPVLMHRAWTPYVFGKRRVAKAVQEALDNLGWREWHLFMSSPLVVPLVRNLNSPVFSLDAQDNLLKHSLYRHVPGLEDYYDHCLAHARALFTNSAETANWLGERRPDARHIANGVDPERFKAASVEVPADMTGLPRPIVGYAGKMQEMFDADAMIESARRFPEASFVCIGQELQPSYTAKLWREPNCYYLGDKPYDALPQYLNAFDICVIPYSVERQHGGDPIKFYEYLAAGKPVVTTEIGAVSRFADFPQVRVVRDAAGFVSALGEFLHKLKRGEEIPNKELPPDCTWKAKADLMLTTMLDTQANGKECPR